MWLRINKKGREGKARKAEIEKPGSLEVESIKVSTFLNFRFKKLKAPKLLSEG